jgi:hypothetical protein
VVASTIPAPFEVNALFASTSAVAPKTRRMIDAVSKWFRAQGGRV